MEWIHIGWRSFWGLLPKADAVPVPFAWQASVYPVESSIDLLTSEQFLPDAYQPVTTAWFFEPDGCRLAIPKEGSSRLPALRDETAADCKDIHSRLSLLLAGYGKIADSSGKACHLSIVQQHKTRYVCVPVAPAPQQTAAVQRVVYGLHNKIETW